ncbi:hypothetical protein ACHAW6_008854 [Cyclotella cf. meneghiniana]
MQQPANTVLTRTDPLHLDQTAYLLENMDLFKIAWRLQSFTSSTLLSRDPTIALEARTLDAEAVPTMSAITLDFSGIMRPSSVTLSSCKLDSSSSSCPTSAHRTVVGTCVDAGPDTSCPMNFELFCSALSSHNQPYFIFPTAFFHLV